MDARTFIDGKGNEKVVDIDALEVLDNGNIVFSASGKDNAIGELSFGEGDLIEYNPDTQEASVFMDALTFSDGKGGEKVVDIDALEIPASDPVTTSGIPGYDFGDSGPAAGTPFA